MKSFAYAVSKPQVTRRGVGDLSLCPRDPLPPLAGAPPWQGTPLQAGKVLLPWHGFEKGEMLSIWSIVYHLLLVAMLQRGRKGGVLTRVVRKNRQYFFVYFTGSFFIIIYLKCTRGEDNLWTHPENSK